MARVPRVRQYREGHRAWSDRPSANPQTPAPPAGPSRRPSPSWLVRPIAGAATPRVPKAATRSFGSGMSRQRREYVFCRIKLDLRQGAFQLGEPPLGPERRHRRAARGPDSAIGWVACFAKLRISFDQVYACRKAGREFNRAGGICPIRARRQSETNCPLPRPLSAPQQDSHLVFASDERRELALPCVLPAAAVARTSV